MKVLVTGNDQIIAHWTYNAFGVLCTNIDLAIAIMENNKIIGSAFFQRHCGPDIELSYFGPGTMTLDIVKGLAKIAVSHFGVSRVTVRTATDNETIQKVEKLGFVREGIVHDHYGENSDAIMFGLFGKNLAKLAGRTLQ
jgi:RimJ/RimL family protein N-acetyltransferase